MRSELGKIPLDTVFKERDSLNIAIVGMYITLSPSIYYRRIYHVYILYMSFFIQNSVSEVDYSSNLSLEHIFFNMVKLFIS